MLVNPTNPTKETTVRDVEAAARATGLQVQVFNASTSREIDAAFARFGREQPDAVFVSLDTFLQPACPIGQLGVATRAPRDISDS